MLAAALCACSNGTKNSNKTNDAVPEKSNVIESSKSKTKSMTVRERMRADGWENLGCVSIVDGKGSPWPSSLYIFVKNNHYTAILDEVMDLDESEGGVWTAQYPVTQGQFEIKGVAYKGCVTIAHGNNRYFNF